MKFIIDCNYNKLYLFNIYYYMKKYFITENQLRGIVDNLIIEEKLLKEHDEVYNLSDLAEVMSRTGYDEETLLKVLQDIYREGGDEEVIKLFKASTQIDIESVSKGRYIFKF